MHLDKCHGPASDVTCFSPKQLHCLRVYCTKSRYSELDKSQDDYWLNAACQQAIIKGLSGQPPVGLEPTSVLACT